MARSPLPEEHVKRAVLACVSRKAGAGLEIGAELELMPAGRHPTRNSTGPAAGQAEDARLQSLAALVAASHLNIRLVRAAPSSGSCGTSPSLCTSATSASATSPAAAGSAADQPAIELLGAGSNMPIRSRISTPYLVLMKVQCYGVRAAGLRKVYARHKRWPWESKGRDDVQAVTNTWLGIRRGEGTSQTYEHR